MKHAKWLQLLAFVICGLLTAIAGVIGVASAIASVIELASGPSHGGFVAFIGLPAIPVAVVTAWATHRLTPPQRLPKAP